MNARITVKHRVWMLALLVPPAIGLLIAGAGAGEPPGASKTVRLVIDYSDGVEKHFVGLPIEPGWTVFDALQAADGHPHGIELEYKDYGPQVGYMVIRIDDLKNQGGGSEARNWVYRVNDKLATKACNRYELEAGDAVRWTFESIKM